MVAKVEVNLLEKLRTENQELALKTGGKVNERNNFVKINANKFGNKGYKPALRGAAFTAKIMAKKSNARRFNDRQQAKIMAERAQTQIGALGGLGAHGLDFGEEDLFQIPVEELKASFSSSALRMVDEDGQYSDLATHQIPSSDEEYVRILREKFNHKEFREGQLRAIKIVLEERSNALVVLATGGGKSLCY